MLALPVPGLVRGLRGRPLRNRERSWRERCCYGGCGSFFKWRRSAGKQVWPACSAPNQGEEAEREGLNELKANTTWIVPTSSMSHCCTTTGIYTLTGIKQILNNMHRKSLMEFTKHASNAILNSSDNKHLSQHTKPVWNALCKSLNFTGTQTGLKLRLSEIKIQVSQEMNCVKVSHNYTIKI